MRAASISPSDLFAYQQVTAGAVSVCRLSGCASRRGAPAKGGAALTREPAACVGCDGVVSANPLTYDACGVCGGTGSSCMQCLRGQYPSSTAPPPTPVTVSRAGPGAGSPLETDGRGRAQYNQPTTLTFSVSLPPTCVRGSLQYLFKFDEFLIVGQLQTTGSPPAPRARLRCASS
jgi:hypothetical protein